MVLLIHGMRLLARGERDTEFRHEIVGLVHEAGNPYYDWLFGGEEAARESLDAVSLKTSSELWPGRARLLVAGSRLLGMYIALEGREVAACRAADTLALLGRLSRGDLNRREALRGRVAESRQLFDPVSGSDYFLSKIGVTAEFRGQRVAGILLDSFLDEGVAIGYGRFRVDVSADNEPAIALYRSRDFRTVHERRLHHMHYVQMMRA